MATIHLMVGFIGFGKTTIAKKLEKSLPAIRFTHDEIMFERYGRNPDDFRTKYKIVDKEIRSQAEKVIKSGQDVILDYGFWSHKQREEFYLWAKNITDDVVFHIVECDLNTAKKRTLERTKNNENALMIDEDIFETLLNQYEPWSDKDNYPAIRHNND